MYLHVHKDNEPILPVRIFCNTYMYVLVDNAPIWFLSCTYLGAHPMYIHSDRFRIVHTYIHTCIHTYIHAYMHTYIHTCIHTFMHTYIHAYIHTYIPTQSQVQNVKPTPLGDMNACVHTLVLQSGVNKFLAPTLDQGCQMVYLQTKNPNLF
jgi:hypothetical protein